MTANDSPDTMHEDMSDAELIRYLDGELNADERRRLEAALDADPERSARLAALRRRGERLHALLAESDPANGEVDAVDPTRAGGVFSQQTARRARASTGPTHDHQPVTASPLHGGRTARPWLRAAIIVFVLGAMAMAVPPVRAWVVDTVRRLAGADDAEPSPEPVTTQPVEVGHEFTIGNITVTGPEFVIEMAAAQTRGTLTLRLTDDVAASATLTEGNAEGFLTMPRGGVHIQNTAASNANYTFTLPRGVMRVILRVAGRAEETIPLDATAPERVIGFGR